MIMPLPVDPYMFLGGKVIDYLVGVGPAGTFHTLHKPTGHVIQSVVPKLADGVGGGNPISLGLNAIGHANTARMLGNLQQAVQLTNMLGVANLGVGVVNLGVGIYNAYQLRQVRKQLDRVDRKLDGMDRKLDGLAADVSELAQFTRFAAGRVDEMLREHGIMLGLLYDATIAVGQRLEQLRAEMQAGFRDLYAAQLSAEARRIRLELEARAFALARHHAALRDSVAEGGLPSARELGSVIEGSTALMAWTDAVRRGLPVDSPARLPLLTVKATGLRLLAEARSLESDDTTTINRERLELLREVSEDARAFVDGRTLHALATTYREVLARYVYLHRGVGLERVDLGRTESGEEVPLVPVSVYVFDDGLSSLRDVDAPAADALDGDALLDGIDPAWVDDWELEHGRVRAPTGADVRAALALPEASVLRRSHLPLAVRGGRERVAGELRRTFNWSAPPRLVLPETFEG